VATAREFAAALCASGLLIVSGLAEGIDTAAHLGALDASADPAGGSVSAPGATPVNPTAGSTLAVIGTGPDRVYPARNRDLATRIAKCGALLSEYRPGTPARKENFPRRNRLISGLARGVLVVEASLSSGSLITARLAGEQGREVFAIPGSIHSPFSRGCHKLIRDGAKLVETAQDVLVELGMTPPGPGRAQTGPKAATNDETSVLLEAMGYDCVAADTLVLRTGLGAAQVTAGLTRLEIERQIAQVPGGYWQRTERRT
jgi:DNA processing protein